MSFPFNHGLCSMEKVADHPSLPGSKPYILKAKKFAEPPFQLKKIADKVRKSGRHFWAILGNFGPF